MTGERTTRALVWAAALTLPFVFWTCSRRAAEPERREETVTIQINPAELSVDPAGRTITFSPDSGVRSAAYTHYEFALEAFVAACGGTIPVEPFEAVIAILETKEETYAPDDPKVPAPAGGFRITRHKAELRAER